MQQKKGVPGSRHRISNKGMTQIDWILSLAIFLIYLILFLITVKAKLTSGLTEALPLAEVKASFLENASWTVNQTPIILRSNNSLSEVPIIMSFQFSGNAESYGIKESYWSIADKRLFFLTSFPSRIKTVTLLHSAENYSRPSFSSAFSPDDQSVSTASMGLTFTDNVLSQAIYRDGIKIRSFSATIEGAALPDDKRIFSSDRILARYRRESIALNHTAYIFVNNSRIFSAAQGDGATLELTLGLDRYGDYYIDGINNGAINYNTSTCDTFTTDYINYYDGDYGLAFIFSDDASVKQCHDGDLEVTVSAELDGEFTYTMVFHDDGSDTRGLRNEYAAEYGLPIVLNGLSSRNLNALKSVNYSLTREEWGRGYDINITVLNASNDKMFTHGTTPYTEANVKGSSTPIWVLDKYGNQSRAALNILLWK